MTNSQNSGPLSISSFTEAILTLRAVQQTLNHALPDIETKCGHDHGLNRADAQVEAIVFWLQSARQRDPANKASELIIAWKIEKNDLRGWHSFHSDPDECMLITISEAVRVPAGPRLIEHTIRITDHDMQSCKSPEVYYFEAVKAGIEALAVKVTAAS